MADDTCPECGLSRYSQEHLEGLNGIHEQAPAQASLTKAELLTLATERGIEVDERMTKAQIIEALEA